MDPNKLTTVEPHDGKTVSVVGDTYRIVVGSEQTGGVYAAIDMLIPPGGGPGPHSHADIEESFLILDGEIEVTNEQGTYNAKQGAFVNIPLGGMVHQFKNTSDKPAHLWCVVAPSGLDEFFEAIGKPVAPGQFLPKPEMTPEDMKKQLPLAEKYGQKIFPPDYFDKK